MGPWYAVGIMVGIGALTSIVFVALSISFTDSDTPMGGIGALIRGLTHAVTIPAGLFIFSVILWNMLASDYGMGWQLVALTVPANEFIHIPSVILGCFGVLSGIVSAVFSGLVGDLMVGLMELANALSGEVVKVIGWAAVQSDRKAVWYGGMGLFAAVGISLVGVWYYFFFVTPPPGW